MTISRARYLFGFFLSIQLEYDHFTPFERDYSLSVIHNLMTSTLSPNKFDFNFQITSAYKFSAAILHKYENKFGNLMASILNVNHFSAHFIHKFKELDVNINRVKYIYI